MDKQEILKEAVLLTIRELAQRGLIEVKKVKP